MRATGEGRLENRRCDYKDNREEIFTGIEGKKTKKD